MLRAGDLKVFPRVVGLREIEHKTPLFWHCLLVLQVLGVSVASMLSFSQRRFSGYVRQRGEVSPISPTGLRRQHSWYPYISALSLNLIRYTSMPFAQKQRRKGPSKSMTNFLGCLFACSLRIACKSTNTERLGFKRLTAKRPFPCSFAYLSCAFLSIPELLPAVCRNQQQYFATSRG